MTKRLSQTEVVARIKAIHGDRVVMVGEYKRSSARTQFKCNEGHQWETTPGSVINVQSGCPHCAIVRKRVSHTKIVARIKKIHGNRVVMVGNYKHTNTRTQFKCNEGHQWETTPSQVISGHQSGCPRCRRLLPRDEVTYRIEGLHGNRVVLVGKYRSTQSITQFKCDQGHRWETSPSNVINQQTGCPRCAPALSLNDVYTRIKKVHGDHVVMVGKYNGTQSKTQFKCDKGHRWETTPSNVMNHQTGCAACASHGFNPSLPGILYYLKVTAPCGVYYKIGITNRSVRHRFVYADDRERIEVLKQWSYQNGHSALRRERSILKTHRAARYKGNPILKSGNTELFTHDVLGLDKGSKAPETAKNRPDDPGPANDNQIKALAA